MPWFLPLVSIASGAAASTYFYNTYDPKYLQRVPKRFTSFSFGCNVGVALWCTLSPAPMYGLAALNAASALWLLTQRQTLRKEQEARETRQREWENDMNRRDGIDPSAVPPPF